MVHRLCLLLAAIYLYLRIEVSPFNDPDTKTAMHQLPNQPQVDFYIPSPLNFGGGITKWLMLGYKKCL